MEEKNKKLIEVEKQLEALTKQKDDIMNEIDKQPVVGKDIIDIITRMEEMKSYILSEVKKEVERCLVLKNDIDRINARIDTMPRSFSTVSRRGLTMTDLSVHGDKEGWDHRKFPDLFSRS